jgi:NAD(P)-dependent dehydrogenase (short-subunit alcohol dehydrogenase family)
VVEYGDEFTGKVAMVTGAANGIGRATTVLLAKAGAKVIACDVDEAGGASTIELVQAAGGEGRFVRTDVSQPEDVERAVATAVETYGGLDIAHNNAGVVGAGAMIPDHTIEDWNYGVGVMLTGVFLGMKYQIPRILERGGGAIVNTSSGAGLIGFPGMANYVASKHGVIGLTKTAALEFGAQGIRINCICPGTARTKMVNDWLGGSAENEAQVAGLHPIGRIAEPEEIGALVLWLCSSGASFMNGGIVPIDGGYTIQ